RNLAAANYTVTVTDNNGCTSVSTLSITEPAVLGASISSTNNVSCNGGSDGTATVTANGGTTPYTYLWSNGQTAVTATNLAATNYVVTVTDNNGCTTTANVTLSEPTHLTTANTYQENVSCNGLSDGLAAITPSGGTAPYTYLWSDNQTADTARNLTAATYTVTVTDNQGCALVENVTISEPVQLSISAQAVSQVSCNGLSNGSASANATGGTSPYSFLWSNNQVGDTARNLGAANYSVTITDQNGCTATTSVTISEPATLVGAIANSFDVSCNGGNDGLAVVDPQGGTAPYTYLWSNNQTADTTRNLNAGNYSVTITDQNACTATTAVIISEPSALTTTISSSTNISCNGLSDGIVTVSANGGTTPYTYLWSDNQTTATASNLPAGNYQVTVSDNNQCTSVESITLTEPASLVCSNGTQINASCKDLSDGSAKVIVNGGTQPYTYLWSDNQQTDSASNLSAGNYSVTVTDQNNCSSVSSFLITEPDSLLSATSITNGVSCTGFSNGEASVSATGGTQPYTYLWSNNSTNDTISGLFAGKYFVTLSDQNGCSIVDSVELVGPTQLVSTIGSSTDVSCNGGSDGFAYANANGGTPPYTYLWSNNANTDTLRNLSAGTYVLTLTDANGCNSGATVTINEPAALGLSITNESMVSCQGLSDAKAYVTVNGGTTPYTYLWNDNQASDTARNLSAGPYSVTVTDANACSSVISTTVTEPNALVSSMGSSTNVNCFGGSDGAATVTANGGTTPYTYNWNNGDNTATSSNLIAGTYFVTITDANGCVDSSNITITEPNLLSTTTSVNSPISCNNAANGIASVSPSGGTAPYTYNWSQGATTASISNLGPGTFLVTVTDNNQCSTVDSVTLVQPATLTTSISNATDVSCFSLADGQASVVGSGGTSPYTYFWSNNETTNSIQNLSAGTYGVTITDARGCQSSSSVSITQPAQLSATLNGSNISCFGQADGQISTAISGGTTPYNYNWSNGEQTPLINNLGAGTYLLTLSDFNNCQVTDSFTVIEPDTLSLTITADDTVCINVPKSLDATASGGTGAYTFTWNQNLGNSPSVSVSPQQNTTYSISVTDANNCPEAVRNVTLTVRDVASDSLNISSSGNICVGDSSLISVDFVGSIGPFSYQWNQTLSGIQDQYVSPTATTTYILDVIDACANTLTDSVEVAVSDPPVIALNDTLIEGCEDLSLTFSNQTPSNYTYSWNFGDGITSTEAEPSNTYTDPGTYSVQLNVSTPEGCESQSQANYRVRVLPSPIASIFASPTETDIENPDITISSDFSDANFWTWNFGDGKDSSNINDFVYTYADTGTYILNLLERNSFNCYDSAQLRIRINPNYEIKIPNVFIPSTGGPTGGTYNPNSTSNAVFHPFLEYVEDYHLMIFNRWGELMFESKDVNIGWDGYYKGKLCQADVYVYKMEVEFINGDRATKVGDLTLLR
ncbi:MAG: PKD domain-containing protein, partial [Vicingaceae bacterium]